MAGTSEVCEGGRVMTQTRKSPAATGLPQNNFSIPDCTPATRQLSARQLRALKKLSIRDLTVAQIRRVAGCSNASDLVATLKERGFNITSIPIEVHDRDGKSCRTVLYRLSECDRQRLARAGVV